MAALVTGDLAFLGGNVEVTAAQNLLALEVDVHNRFLVVIHLHVLHFHIQQIICFGELADMLIRQLPVKARLSWRRGPEGRARRAAAGPRK